MAQAAVEIADRGGMDVAAAVDDPVVDLVAGDRLVAGAGRVAADMAGEGRAVIVDRAQAVAARVVDTVGRAGMAAVELAAVATPATLAVAAATSVVAAPATTTAAIAS